MSEHESKLDDQWVAFVAHLEKITDGRWFKAAEVAKKIDSPDPLPENLIYPWHTIWTRGGDFGKALGRSLGSRAGQTFGDLTIRCVRNEKRGHLYKIEKV